MDYRRVMKTKRRMLRTGPILALMDVVAGAISYRYRRHIEMSVGKN